MRSGAAREAVQPGVGVILESGQGSLVLDSIGGGSLMMARNDIDGQTGYFNFGVAGDSTLISPQAGGGTLMQMRCIVGPEVSPETSVRVTPELYPGITGAILVDEPARAPVIDTFIAGTITVAGANQAPVIEPIDDQIVTAGDLLRVPLSASDPDGDSIQLVAAAELPSSSRMLDRGNGRGVFVWTPELDEAGSYQVTFVARDTGVPTGSDSETIRVTVEPGIGNVPSTPEFPQIEASGGVVMLTWSGSETATRFIIYRRLQGEPTFHRIGDTTAWFYDDQLTNRDDAAEYRVLARNAFGQGKPSRVVRTR